MPTSFARRMLPLGVVALLIAGVAGCTATASADTTPVPSGSDAIEAAALTCGATAVIVSNLYAADSDVSAGRISEADWVAAVNLAKTDFDGIHRFRDWGLQAHVGAITEYMTGSPETPAGAAYDSTTAEFNTLVGELRAACEANGTPVSTFATSGG